MALNQKSADKFLKFVQKLIKYLAIFLALFGIATVLLSVFKVSSNNLRLKSSGNLEEAMVQPDSSWNKYSNKSTGISFKYPMDWELSKMGESSNFEQITIESSCDIELDSQCATVSFYPYKTGVDATPYYDESRITNRSSVYIDGVKIEMFDFDYSPINSLEKIYQFSYKGINYEVTYFETTYKNGEVYDPTKLVYSSLVDQIIRSLDF